MFNNLYTSNPAPTYYYQQIPGFITVWNGWYFNNGMPLVDQFGTALPIDAFGNVLPFEYAMYGSPSGYWTYVPAQPVYQSVAIAPNYMSYDAMCQSNAASYMANVMHNEMTVMVDNETHNLTDAYAEYKNTDTSQPHLKKIYDYKTNTNDTYVVDSCGNPMNPMPIVYKHNPITGNVTDIEKDERFIPGMITTIRDLEYKRNISANSSFEETAKTNTMKIGELFAENMIKNHVIRNIEKEFTTESESHKDMKCMYTITPKIANEDVYSDAMGEWIKSGDAYKWYLRASAMKDAGLVSMFEIGTYYSTLGKIVKYCTKFNVIMETSLSDEKCTHLFKPFMTVPKGFNI